MPIEAEKQQLIAFGTAEIHRRFPDFDPEGMTPILTDREDNWELTYQLPDDWLGGAPVIVFRKSNRGIVDIYRTQ